MNVPTSTYVLRNGLSILRIHCPVEMEQVKCVILKGPDHERENTNAEAIIN